MIRSLSQKRMKHDIRKQASQNEIDVERTKKTPFSIYSQNGRHYLLLEILF